MKRTILLSLFALLLAPAFAAAAEAPPIDDLGCDSALSFLAAAPVTPAGNAAVTLTGLEGIVEVQSSSCCAAARRRCERTCAPCGGVFEFNCDPATCQSSCICFICP